MGLTTTFHVAALRDTEHLLLPCAPPYPSPQTHTKNKTKKTPQFSLIWAFESPRLGWMLFSKVLYKWNCRRENEALNLEITYVKGALERSLESQGRGHFQCFGLLVFIYKMWTSCSGHCSGTTKPINFPLNSRTFQGLSGDWLFRSAVQALSVPFVLVSVHHTACSITKASDTVDRH